MEPLAYSTNVHAAEGLQDIAWALVSGAGRIRRELDLPILGLDLKLGSQAVADRREHPTLLDELRRVLDTHGLKVTSINAFPLGVFQSGRVKDDAYRPDWRDDERLETTLAILDMAEALCPVEPLVLSTVPGSFKAWGDDARVHAEIAAGLGRFCAAAARRERSGGRRAVLALEPEPRCTLERAAEVRTFFAGPLSTAGVMAAAALLDGDEAAARAAIDRHLGICFDTCHASVVFDDQAEAVRLLRGCGAGIAKCQFSAAPAADADEDGVRALAALDEPRFLHQVYGRGPTGVAGRDDLDQLPALLEELPGATELRCHFHIPVDAEPAAPLRSTRRDSLRGLEACLGTGCAILSVETYTWSVLADGGADLIGGTARELAWLAERLR